MERDNETGKDIATYQTCEIAVQGFIDAISRWMHEAEREGEDRAASLWSAKLGTAQQILDQIRQLKASVEYRTR